MTMRIPPGHCWWLILFALATTPLRAADDKAIVDAAVTPFLKDKDYLGLVVGTTRSEGNQVFSYGTVMLGGKKQPPAADTVFEIGSISKVFTGVLLAALVVEGKVRLDDPAQKYLPENLKLPRRDNRDITLLHLATHTSSLPGEPPDIIPFAEAHKSPLDPYGAYRLPDLGKSLLAVTLDCPIGSKFAYSNLGTGLLGHALVNAAGAKNYEDLLARRLSRSSKVF